jgi:hypothetical protein
MERMKEEGVGGIWFCSLDSKGEWGIWLVTERMEEKGIANGSPWYS